MVCRTLGIHSRIYRCKHICAPAKRSHTPVGAERSEHVYLPFEAKKDKLSACY